MTLSKLALAMALSSSVLVGCGGSSGGDSTENGGGGTGSNSLSFDVVDGPLKGATGWIDLNGNLLLDEGEPSALSDDNGLVQVSYEGDLPADALLIGHVHAGQTVDIDDNRTFAQDMLLLGEVGDASINPFTTLKMLYRRSGEGDEAAAAAACSWVGEANCQLDAKYSAQNSPRAYALARQLMNFLELQAVLDNPAAVIAEVEPLLSQIDAAAALVVAEGKTPQWRALSVIEDGLGGYQIDGLMPLSGSVVAGVPQAYTLYSKVYDQNDPYRSSIVLDLTYNPAHGFIGLSMPGDLVYGYLEKYPLSGTAEVIVPYGQIKQMLDESGYQYTPDHLQFDPDLGISIVSLQGTTVGETPASIEMSYRFVDWNGEITTRYRGEVAEYEELEGVFASAFDAQHVVLSRYEFEPDMQLSTLVEKYNLQGERVASLLTNSNVDLSDASLSALGCHDWPYVNQGWLSMKTVAGDKLCVIDAGLTAKQLIDIDSGAIVEYIVVSNQRVVAVTSEDDPDTRNHHFFYIKQFDGEKWTQVAALGSLNFSTSFELGQAADGRVVVAWTDSVDEVVEDANSDNYLDQTITQTLHLAEVSEAGELLEQSAYELAPEQFDFSAGEIGLLSSLVTEVSTYGAVFVYQRMHASDDGAVVSAYARVIPFKR